MIQEERPITYYNVTLGALTREGDALAEISEVNAEGERHCFALRVPAGLPGERVTIAVEAPAAPRPGRRSRRWKPRPPRVWISEIHEPSPLRIAASCSVFGTCGGCQLQHMRYDAQLEWKRNVVAQLLAEAGFTDPPLLATVPCAIPWHYRNHMRFSVNRSGQPGLTARGTHRVLPLTDCPIAHEKINRALQVISQHTNPQPQVLIRCGAGSGQMLIQPQQSMEVARQLTEAGLDLHNDTMEECLAGETFRIRPSSFFQTNSAQAETMMRMVLSGLLSADEQRNGVDQSDRDDPGETSSKIARMNTKPLTIADAYCGVGTFALFLARHVERVIAIEESASAIKDAQWNLQHAKNVEILKGKVEDLLPTLASQLDGLVIDPPRAGCQPDILEALAQHPVTRIVYVSCDPSTLTRDLNILCNEHRTYHLRSVQPLDMFPQTAHIETVTVLERAVL